MVVAVGLASVIDYLWLNEVDRGGGVGKQKGR